MKRRSFLGTMLAAPLAWLAGRSAPEPEFTVQDLYRERLYGESAAESLLRRHAIADDGSHETHLLQHALMRCEIQDWPVLEIVMGREFHDLVLRQMVVLGQPPWRVMKNRFELRLYDGYPVKLYGLGRTGHLVLKPRRVWGSASLPTSPVSTTWRVM